NEVCTANSQCCSGLCTFADNTNTLKRCAKNGSCLKDGEVCGGQGASQNCCNSDCKTTSIGVKRCFGGAACKAAGASCTQCDDCCSHVCAPNGGSPTGFSCAATCLPLAGMSCNAPGDCGSPLLTCTTNADCCVGTCVFGFCGSS